MHPINGFSIVTTPTNLRPLKLIININLGASTYGRYVHAPAHVTMETVVPSLKVCSGLLLGVVSKHYQPIECLRYIDNGHFVSGGRDCLAIVWNLAR